jgi:diguanylate cyclase (GGDEF)-like protein/PAS domain S-box-containing protein
MPHAAAPAPYRRSTVDEKNVELVGSRALHCTMVDHDVDDARRRPLHDPRTLRLLVHHLPAAVYVTNRAGDILDANPAFLELFGVPSLNDLAGYRAGDLFSDPGSRDEQLERLERSGSLHQYEIELQRPDGAVRTAIDTCYAVPGAGGSYTYHGILIDITDRKQLEDRLLEASRRDALTGCFNRRHLRLTAEALPPGVDWAAIVIDIDHFKGYNDRHGHDEGDRVLIATARWLQEVVRAEDLVVRLGGDEFLVLLVGRSAGLAVEVARRLSSGDAPVPISCGWARRREDEPLQATISRADAGLIERRRREREDPDRPGG